MTERELQQIATRERVTLRRREQHGRLYWYAYGRHQGDLHSTYLTADSRLPSFTEADFLKKVRGLPGRSGTDEQLIVQPLPGRAALIAKGNRKMALSAEELTQLAQWIDQQQEEVS